MPSPVKTLQAVVDVSRWEKKSRRKEPTIARWIEVSPNLGYFQQRNSKLLGFITCTHLYYSSYHFQTRHQRKISCPFSSTNHLICWTLFKTFACTRSRQFTRETWTSSFKIFFMACDRSGTTLVCSTSLFFKGWSGEELGNIFLPLYHQNSSLHRAVYFSVFLFSIGLWRGLILSLLVIPFLATIIPLQGF